MMLRSICLAVLLCPLLAIPAFAAADLLEVYDLAVQRDPTLRQALAQRNAALENRPQAIANLLPQISASYSHNSVNESPPPTVGVTASGARIVNPNYISDNVVVSLTQAIIRPQFWIQLAAADDLIAQAEATYQAAQQDLMLRTAQAYFDVLFNEENVEVSKSQVESVGKQLEQAKARFEVGLTAITDMLEAQAQYDSATAAQITAQRQLDDGKEALRQVIGEFDKPLARLRENLPLSLPKPNDVEQWSHAALSTNPTIIAAQSGAAFARKEIKRNLAGHLPTLDGTAAYNFAASDRFPATNDQGQIININNERQVLGLQVNIPIYQGGAVNSRTRQARSNFEAAQEGLDGQRRTVVRQVKDAFRGVHAGVATVKALAAAVVSAQKALEATEAGLQVGTRTIIDVLLQQSTLYTAQRDYARARSNYVISGLQLKQGVGALGAEDLTEVNGWLRKDADRSLSLDSRAVVKQAAATAAGRKSADGSRRRSGGAGR